MPQPAETVEIAQSGGIKIVLGTFIKRMLESVERKFSEKSERPLRYPPIFIIGPPRSGSTLLSQVLIERFKLGYFSNVHEKFYANPALVERLVHVSRWPRSSVFQSKHGKTPGWTGPSESGKYWYRFFPRRPQYLDEGDASQEKLAELRGSIRALGNAFKRPLLIKNLPCALRLGPLQQALPEALYLIMQRDWVEMGCSILLARMRINHSYDKWLSLEPPGFEQLEERPAFEQVVEQIRLTYDLIDEARAGDLGDRFFEVTYEDFCDDVHRTIDSIARFAAAHGVMLEPRREVPSRFDRSLGGAIESELISQLDAYVKHTKPSNHKLNREPR